MPETKTLAVAPRPAAGGTGLLTYRPWRGRLGGPARGVWAIARSGLWMLLRRWTFWGLYAGCLLIFLFFFFGQYLLVWIGTQLQEENVRFLFGSRIEPARLSTPNRFGRSCSVTSKVASRCRPPKLRISVPRSTSTRSRLDCHSGPRSRSATTS